jgi:hypothetical protein
MGNPLMIEVEGLRATLFEEVDEEWLGTLVKDREHSDIR